jgi:hypothetical protein
MTLTAFVESAALDFWNPDTRRPRSDYLVAIYTSRIAGSGIVDVTCGR